MEDKNKKNRICREVRSYGEMPRLREAGEGGESRVIEGYAIVFGVESVLLVDWYDRYREIIEPGAIDEAALRTMDITMTMWHNRERLLARWNKGEGSLKLSVDERGVKYEFEAPRTADGENALELVKRGDISGASFTFWSDETSSVRYTKSDDGVLLRHVQRIDAVYEMTIASNPAYTETSVTAREVEAGLGSPLKPEEKKEDKEAREKAEREAAAVEAAKKFREEIRQRVNKINI